MTPRRSGSQAEINARSTLERSESVLDVLRVWTLRRLSQVVAGVGHDVAGPVRRLLKFIVPFGEEDVPQHHAADGRVRLDG